MATRRQQIVSLLEREGALSFEDLREALGVPVHLLKADLPHVEKSLKASGRTLVVEPPRCLECGFVFTGRGKKHFHAPSRCPECRSERIGQPRMEVK